MNIDRDLVARAFTKAGEEPITDTEWSDADSSRVRVVKEFYLATLLEALSSYDWTSQKKRARLTPLTLEDLDSEDAEENLTGFMFMYALPMDCAKVIAVDDGEPYIVEGGFLFCDKESVVLLYVRNYFTGRYVYEQVANPTADDVDKYYYKDENGDYIKETTFDMSKTYYVIVEEDYNFYGQPVLDPELSSYIECKLAAGIALKLTGGTDKYQMLYNEARLIADGAMKRSAEQAKNKHKGNKWWTDQLGLTSGGEIHADY